MELEAKIRRIIERIIHYFLSLVNSLIFIEFSSSSRSRLEDRFSKIYQLFLFVTALEWYLQKEGCETAL